VRGSSGSASGSSPVTGAIGCSRVTYSICRYDSNNRSKRGYSYENIRENICCDFKRNNILDRCYRDEEGNTRGPYAPYIHRLSVFPSPPLATVLSFHSSTSFSSSPLFGVRFFRSLARLLSINIFATSLVLRRPLSRRYARGLACASLLLFLLSMFRSETDRLGLPQRSPLMGSPCRDHFLADRVGKLYRYPRLLGRRLAHQGNHRGRLPTYARPHCRAYQGDMKLSCAERSLWQTATRPSDWV
jgi:hypothetical protein